MSAMPTTILITGASNGIGEALAKYYAKPAVHLVLTGRSAERLDAVAASCRALGASVTCGLIDVRDRQELSAFIAAADAATPIDLVIANAGVTGGVPDGGAIEPAEVSAEIVEVNVMGVLNTLHPLLPRMIARRRGQIAVLSSLAGLAPLPDGPTYSASKAAMLYYGLALRGALRPQGVKVSVVCAGYVTTEMSQRVVGWKPGEILPDQAAHIIARGLRRNKAVIAFPWLLALVAKSSWIIPDRLQSFFLAPFRFNIQPPGSTAARKPHDSSSRSST